MPYIKNYKGKEKENPRAFQSTLPIPISVTTAAEGCKTLFLMWKYISDYAGLQVKNLPFSVTAAT